MKFGGEFISHWLQWFCESILFYFLISQVNGWICIKPPIVEFSYNFFDLWSKNYEGVKTHMKFSKAFFLPIFLVMSSVGS